MSDTNDSISSRSQRRALIPDDSTDKWFPNSIKKTFRSIRSYWPSDLPINRRGRGVSNFHILFEDIFEGIRKKYGRNRKVEHPDAQIESLEAGTASLTYYMMRVYSEIVGVPTGVLLMYTHLLGDSWKGNTLEEQTNFLDSAISALEAMKHALGVREQIDNPLFAPGKKDPKDYEAKLGVLIAASNAYRNYRQTPATQSDNWVG